MNRQSFESKLDSYERSAIPGKSNSWSVFSAALGVAMCVGHSSEAAVVYSGLQNLNIQDYLASSGTEYGTGWKRYKVLFNFDGSGLATASSPGLDVGLALHVTSYSSSAILQARGRNDGYTSTTPNYPGSGMFFVNPYANNIPNGAPIPVTSSFSSVATFGLLGRLLFPGSYVGYWVPGSPGFLGFRFKIDSQDHYGWMQVEADVGFKGGTVIDWAYEDQPNTPILAGDVPEPGTSTLGLLAMGAVGLSAYRRNRKRADS